jgi:hypothetical protein
MSSTGRSAVRLEDDFYVTPSWVVARLLEEVDLPGGDWLECCAGGGEIIKVVNDLRQDINWYAIEKREDLRDSLVSIIAEDRVEIDNYLEMEIERRFSVVITNPPYSHALSVIYRSFMIADWVVMLLRLNFMSSVKRVGFMRRYCPNVYVLPNRPSFTGGGTDSTEYGWFVWSPNRSRSEGMIKVLRPTNVVERRTSHG